MLRHDVRSQRDHPWLQIFCPQRRKKEVDRLDYDFAKDVLRSEGGEEEDLDRRQPCQPKSSAMDKCEACQTAGVECDPIPGCACAQCKRGKKRCSMAKKRQRSSSATPDSRQGSGHVEVRLPLKKTRKEPRQTRVKFLNATNIFSQFFREGLGDMQPMW
ncbi:hypothetical protein OG21DRAFT_1510526 [Imleria badia]|nr:hypothetical protein OG21DRAFT_1510526 [Imleria badia]